MGTPAQKCGTESSRSSGPPAQRTHSLSWVRQIWTDVLNGTLRSSAAVVTRARAQHIACDFIQPHSAHSPRMASFKGRGQRAAARDQHAPLAAGCLRCWGSRACTRQRIHGQRAHYGGPRVQSSAWPLFFSCDCLKLHLVRQTLVCIGDEIAPNEEVPPGSNLQMKDGLEMKNCTCVQPPSQ